MVLFIRKKIIQHLQKSTPEPSNLNFVENVPKIIAVKEKHSKQMSSGVAFRHDRKDLIDLKRFKSVKIFDADVIEVSAERYIR